MAKAIKNDFKEKPKNLLFLIKERRKKEIWKLQRERKI
jgi:hypothetical protein